MTRSQKFILDNKKVLGEGPNYFNPDTSYMPYELWDQKKVHFMLIFPTPAAVKTVSSTAAAINDYIITHCPDVYVDFAYVPDASDIKVYDKYNMPYCIGLNSHLDASHFEFVGFSISVLHEVIGMATILNSFKRCDKPIPLTWSERRKSLLGTYPVIYAGGITAACGDIMYGEVPGHGKAYADFSYLGDCVKMSVMYTRYIQAIETGVVKRYPEDRTYPGMRPDPVEYEEEVKVITIQDYINSLMDMRWIYQPQSYEVKWNDKTQIISNKKINPKAQDWVKPCYPHELEPDLGIGRSIIPASGDNTGVSQVQVSEGCSAAGACSFCSEGNYTGGWTEKSHEEILREMRESKKYNAAWTQKMYSFNANYVTDYKGLLYKILEIYPRATFINMRMEELGQDPDALKMMKLVGSNRLSCPLEGLSPRLMNNFMNKCLSEESIKNVMEYTVHGKMMDVKIGAIFTAYETDEDFQWICDFFDQYNEKAQREGGNFTGRLKATPLVSYNLTPFEYIERKSAKKSMFGEHWLSDEWYEKFREHNVYFKVNGFRYSTFIEQSIIDLGRLATPLVQKYIVDPEIPIYSLRSVAYKEKIGEKEVYPFVDALKRLINPDYFFEARDPEHYISPSHRIHIDLMGSYIPRARRLIRAYKEGKHLENEPDIRCLKTREGAKTKCYKVCIKNDPLKIYSDVEMDEEGNLHGDYRELIGCERCTTPLEQKARIAREIKSTKNSADLMAMPKIPKVLKTRFILKRDPFYDILNPHNTAYTAMARLLQTSDKLLDTYRSLEGHSMYWTADPNCSYPVSGLMMVEVWWKEDVFDEIQRCMKLANQNLKASQFLKVSRIFDEEKIKLTDYNIIRFESTLPYEVWQNGVVNYDQSVKVCGDMGTFNIIQDKSLKPPVIQNVGKVIGYAAVPMRHNPFFYLQGVLGVKKVSESKLMQSTNISCVMSVRESTNVVCRNCGKEQATISLTTDKSFPFGPNCLIKALLSNEIKQKSSK